MKISFGPLTPMPLRTSAFFESAVNLLRGSLMFATGVAEHHSYERFA